MSLLKVRRLKGMPDAVAQRAHDAVSDAVDHIVSTVQQALTLTSTGVTCKVPLTVTGAATVNGPATISGAVTIGGNETVSGNLTVSGTGGIQAPNGVQQGSRFLALRGCVGQNQLATNGTYQAQAYYPGSTPGFSSAVYVPAYSGSIAAIMVKVYTASATAGTLTLATTGATTNPSVSGVTFTQVNNNYVATFTPGAYPFTAGQGIFLQATSSGWTQGAGATGIELDLWVYC